MKWTRLESKDKENCPSPRSSHSITALNNKLYVFGGENEPRIPINSDMHVYDLENQKWTKYSSSSAPAPRFAHSTVALGNKLFIYGGRDHNGCNLDELLVFDTDQNKWQDGVVVTNGQTAGGRSYHSATKFDSNNNQFFVFGGCGEKDRLNNLSLFDANNSMWTDIQPRSGQAPCARGGPGFSAVGDSLLYVYAGFNGTELGDLHVFDFRDYSWRDISNQVTGTAPEARSVHVMRTLGTNLFVFGGEREASKIGHAGAGKFRSDAFLFNTQASEWTLVETESGKDQTPSERGWLDGTALNDTTLALFGGYCETSRLNDLFLFQK